MRNDKKDRKLTLKKESLRKLAGLGEEQLRAVAGGEPSPETRYCCPAGRPTC